jgi:hypothetical protein
MAATISDSLSMKISGKTTACEIWEALTGDFEKQLRMFSVDLRSKLQQERCIEKADVRAPFSQLRTMRKKLVSMGQPSSEGDFYSIILGSLRSAYDPHISPISATSSVVGKTLSPDALMHAVTNEFDRHILSSMAPIVEVRPLSGRLRLLGRGRRKGGEGSNRKRNGQWQSKGQSGHPKSRRKRRMTRVDVRARRRVTMGV